MSKQQQVVYDIIKNSKEHLCAEQVFLRAKQILPKIAMGTVYRNLNQLVDDKKIRRVIVPGYPDHFDGILEEHEHLFCDGCKQIKDIHIEGLKNFIESNIHIDIDSLDLNIHYLCDDCKKKM